jgi:iron complex transport system substrate-binding protein
MSWGMVRAALVFTAELKFRCKIVFAWILLYPAFLSAEPCERIVSLAPSITEVLGELDLNEHVVAVTRYDAFLKSEKKVEDIGGFLDTNVEKIASLNPSVVFVLSESGEAARLMQALSVKTVTVNHKSVSGILASLEQIADQCALQKLGKEVRERLELQFKALKEKVKGLPKKRVLILVRNDGDDDTGTYFVSGNDGFYNEVLEAAGGINVFQGKTTALGTISDESIVQLNPEVVLHLVPSGKSRITALYDRKSRLLENVKAVHDKAEYFLDQDYAMIPGPRFVLLAEKIAKLLHEN